MSHFVLPTTTVPAPGDEACDATDTLAESWSESSTEVISPGEDEEPDTIEIPQSAGALRWHEMPSRFSARQALGI